MSYYTPILQVVVSAFLLFATARASDDAGGSASRDTPNVQIDVCIVEIPSAPAVVTPKGEEASQAKAAAVAEEQSDDGDTPEPDADETAPVTLTDSMQVKLLRDGRHLRIGDALYVVRKARLEAEEEAPGAQGLKVIASPSLRVRVGEQAAITIGQSLSYMEKLENGDLRLVVKRDCVEGVELQALVSEVKEQLIHLEKLSVSLKTIAGREPIEGVPFDVGRPVIQTREVACSLKMVEGHTALVPLPIDDKQTSTVLLLIAMRVVPEPQTGP